MTLTPRALKSLRKKQDLQIETIVRTRLSGVPINILDISKVFRAGYAAFDAGEDAEAAVVHVYRSLSVA